MHASWPYGALGPALRFTPKLSQDTSISIVQHGLFHLLSGVTPAFVTDQVGRRI